MRYLIPFAANVVGFTDEAGRTVRQRKVFEEIEFEFLDFEAVTKLFPGSPPPFSHNLEPRPVEENPTAKVFPDRFQLPKFGL
jgi:hypothetical protein